MKKMGGESVRDRSDGTPRHMIDLTSGCSSRSYIWLPPSGMSSGREAVELTESRDLLFACATMTLQGVSNLHSNERRGSLHFVLRANFVEPLLRFLHFGPVRKKRNQVLILSLGFWELPFGIPCICNREFRARHKLRVRVAFDEGLQQAALLGKL